MENIVTNKSAANLDEATTKQPYIPPQMTYALTPIIDMNIGGGFDGGCLTQS